MEILNAEPKNYSKEAIKIYKKIGNYYELECDRKKLIANISNKHVLIVRLANKIDEALLEHAKKLKYIISPTTGLNHIELKSIKKRNIKLISLKGESKFLSTITSTAELNWFLITLLYRNIFAAFNDVKTYGWNRNIFIQNQIKNKCIGIIGYGRIGKLISKFAKAFDLKIVFFDPAINIYPKYVSKVTLSRLLEISDIISINCELTNNTVNLINKKTFSLMKKTAIIVNTARGEIIDESALLEALVSKKISGAALDVLSNESDLNFIKKLKSNELLKYAINNKNLIVTPHIGGATYEAMESTEIFIAQKFEKTLMGMQK
jgi:D-3-phosphoglycerate dehydrogenase